MHIVYLNLKVKPYRLKHYNSKVFTFVTIVSPRPFPYGAIGPMVVRLCPRLRQCLTIKPLRNGYPKRIVAEFGRTFEMCDREGQNFGWFIEVLRICLSVMEGPLELFYSPNFWVHFSLLL